VCGTALTEEHVKALGRKSTNRLIAAFVYLLLQHQLQRQRQHKFTKSTTTPRTMIRGVWNQVSSSIGMGSPLSNAGEAALNSATPSKISSQEYEVRCTSQTYTDTDTDTDTDGPPSSPFVANIAGSTENSENPSPGKVSRLAAKSPIEREPTSPLKMLKSRTTPSPKTQPLRKTPQTISSPRKLSSPEKRFPVKPSSPEKRPVERTLDIQNVLRENEGLTKAIEILEDADSDTNEDHPADDTLTSLKGLGYEDPNFDDTMASTFSDFSAVPDMTMFAKIGHSPTKYSGMGPTPKRSQMNTPATARRPMNNRSPSPTPRGHRRGQSKDEGNTTNLILDFTEQFNGLTGRSNQSPIRQARQSPTKGATMTDKSWSTTPSVNRRTMSNLLDFDIPPAPTPRSMPTITPRELESLKSNFLSEISSLKASLSGKEAEVQSLKTAVGDAEKRVGESLEQVREERDRKEQLAAEKEEWEKRGREMEAVLRNVKEEIVHGERERDELEGRLEENERRREAAEMMAQEAESKMAAMKAGKVPPTADTSGAKSDECCCGGRAVEHAVEKVSRELHTLYKDKHETKVAALKKSYEKRWDKKVKELETQVEDLTKENEELKLGRDTTMTKVDSKNPLEITEDLEKRAARDAKTKELQAELEGLMQEVKSVKHDNAELRKLLDEERVEKGKLVAAVDEMIPLVAAFDDMLANMDNVPVNLPSTEPQQQRQPSTVENLRGSISRASGLRAPSSISTTVPVESRIGRGGFGAPSGSGHERSRSGSAQGGRPGSGLGYRSGIMSSIEKMGNYKGRGE
jgi:phage shock protein A